MTINHKSKMQQFQFYFEYLTKRLKAEITQEVYENMEKLHDKWYV